MIVSACVMPPLPRHARCTVHVTAPHTLGPAVQCVVSGMPFESCGRSVFSRVGQCVVSVWSWSSRSARVTRLAKAIQRRTTHNE